MVRIMKYIAILLGIALLESCQSEESFVQDGTGYLRLDVKAVSGTNTKSTVPENYNPKQLRVDIKDEAGTVVKSTDNYEEWDGTQIKLKKGSYTVFVSSNGWDGNASGVDIPYYAGSQKVTIEQGKEAIAEIVCTLANVKVTAKFDESVFEKFRNVIIEVTPDNEDIKGHYFLKDGSVYFPVGDLTIKTTVVNKSGESHSLTQELKEVKARDHYILNCKTEETGTGNITVEADDTEKEYEYTFTVPVVSTTSLNVNAANAWSSFAYVEGSATFKDESTIDKSKMVFEYKGESSSNWSSVPATLDGNDFKATLTGLLPNTIYSYKMTYQNGSEEYTSSEHSFTTEAAVALSNGNMNSWHKSGNTWYPNAEGVSFWDSSNPGTTTGAGALVNVNPTYKVDNPVHTSGGNAAALKSQYASAFGIGKFAAGSLYAGSFNSLVGTNGAKIDFGRSFTTRPTQLTGWFQYSTGKIDYAQSGLPVKEGDSDLWSAYIVLTTDTYQLDNTEMSKTSKDFGALLKDDDDKFVVAYGALPDEECITSSEWKKFTIDLTYKNLEAKPTHIIIVFSSSKYGDYFTGSTSSLLYLDDLELIYGDSPNVK